MFRDIKTFSIRLAALGAAACSSVYGTASAPSQPLVATSHADNPAPYQVDLLASDGTPLETYQRGRRFYVLGQTGDRYSIRVTNPTAERIEAVISVDGLDVIDGESADFVHKRGYVVQPYGQVVVDGFRTSTTQVAAFRFSDVSSSYAGRKGKARNVGVVGVAIFAERAAPVIVQPEARELPPPPPVYDGDESAPTGGAGRGYAGGAPAGAGNTRSAPTRSYHAHADSPRPAAPPADKAATGRMETQGTIGHGECCISHPTRQRPGLGTAWGEQRYSAVQFTRFQRSNERVPTAMATLRYNDADGLRALGIAVRPSPGPEEVYTRETADPFPDSHFAAPPR